MLLQTERRFGFPTAYVYANACCFFRTVFILRFKKPFILSYHLSRTSSPSADSSQFVLAGQLNYIYRNLSLCLIFRFLSPNSAPQIQDEIKHKPTTTKKSYNLKNMHPLGYVSLRNFCTARSQDNSAPCEIQYTDSNSKSRYYEDGDAFSDDSGTLSDVLVPNNNVPVKDESSSAALIQHLLKSHQDRAARESALNQCGVAMTENLVLQVLERLRSDWKPALFFFLWASSQQNYSHGSRVYNEMLDILGKMKRFDTMQQLLKEMHSRESGTSLITNRTFAILLNRYAADHRAEEAIEMFYKREEFGLKLDQPAFHTLLMSLCRYKHVEEAESLFHLKQKEFKHDIKSRNIILNGWCVRGNFREVKRFWNDIISSKCKPDLFTYGIFINSLTKVGKVNTALKLFTAMWEKGITPDVTICNCIIDALCFKKRIPEALSIFGEMNERGCLPDVATYNSLIKNLCNIRRMEKAYELLDNMEQKGCMPNARTYNYFLKSMKSPEEPLGLLERMAKTGVRTTGDTYNLILRMYLGWNDLESAHSLWAEMEKNGMGPDQRSYTIMIHSFYSKGMMDEALKYIIEMKSKGMRPEPRTVLLAKAIVCQRNKNS